MTIEEAFEELESYIDASDPDLDLVSQAVKITLSWFGAQSLVAITCREMIPT